jgi:hypothetical protein
MRTKTLAMARDKDTCKNFVAWYREEFGFRANAATALYDVKMLKTCSTLNELDNKAIANTCKAFWQEGFTPPLAQMQYAPVVA